MRKTLSSGTLASRFTLSERTDGAAARKQTRLSYESGRQTYLWHTGRVGPQVLKH